MKVSGNWQVLKHLFIVLVPPVTELKSLQPIQGSALGAENSPSQNPIGNVTAGILASLRTKVRISEPGSAIN